MARQSSDPARAAELHAVPIREAGEEALPQSSTQARDFSWASTLGKLRQQQGSLQSLRDMGLGRVQRWMGHASTFLPPSELGGMCGIFDTLPFTAETLLLGYAQGIYALDVNGQARWHCPADRFILYLRQLRVSPELRRDLARVDYTVTFDRAPDQVLEACAAPHEANTWLSERFIQLYLELFELGAMHTVETWKDGTLVAGSFGVSIGRVWSSEGLFERAPLAAEAQFARTAAHLLERGFELMDAQLYSDQLARLGAREVPIAEYRAALARGLAAPVSFHAPGAPPSSGTAPL